MPSQTLLAHVVAQFASRQWENVATEALHFLLQRPGADSAVRDVLAPAGFQVPVGLTWRTQASDLSDTSRPDLVADDAQGRHVVIIEAKFWAGLTANQPNGYLGRQARQFSGGTSGAVLVFLAPQQRLDTLAAELQMRLGVPTEMRGGLPVLVRDDQPVVLVSWAQVLNALEVSLASRNDHEAVRDLAQLRGLCDRADAEAVLPLDEADVDAERGRRYYQYCDLVDRVADRLVRSGTVDTKRLKATGAKGWYGRYLRASNGQVFLLYVSAYRWANSHPTPWWIRLWRATEDLVVAVRELQAAGVALVQEDGGNLYVGLKAPLHVEDERIVASLTEVVQLVCRALPAEAVVDTPPEAVEDAVKGFPMSESADLDVELG